MSKAVAFTHVDDKNVQRSTFDLSHYHVTTQNHGELLPVFFEEVLPGDTFKLKTNVLARYMPLANPPMSPLKLQVHYFYVPNRLLMRSWENFMLGRKEGGNNVPMLTIPPDLIQDKQFIRILNRLGFPTTKYVPIHEDDDPEKPIVGYDPQDIEDIPEGVFSILPLLAYYRVWIDYFVDQNLDPAFESFYENNYDDGLTSANYIDALTTLTNTGSEIVKYRAWESDYFTSMLPWPQRGDAVLLPMEFSNELIGIDSVSTIVKELDIDDPATGSLSVDGGDLKVPTDVKVYIESLGLIPADVFNGASQATINDLRYSIRLQKFLETNARVGLRYAQRIAYEYNIDESRLDDHRTVYLGDFTQRVQISEVPQTSESTENSPLGALGANATVAGGEFNFDYNFPDYGFVIGIASIMTEPMYCQGIPSKFYKLDPMDYYRPEFEGIGEQPVLRQELVYMETDTAGYEDSANLETLGFLPYGSDYRTIVSRFTGDTQKTLRQWHLGRIFDSTKKPVLNRDLVYTEGEDFNRIFAVENAETDQVILHFHFDLKATRPLSVFGTPASL